MVLFEAATDYVVVPQGEQPASERKRSNTVLPSEAIPDHEVSFRKTSLCTSRTGLERILFLLVALCVLLIICLFGYLLARNRHSIHDAVCTTPGCVKAAADLLAAMDSTVDPCDDFFQYACGQWNRLHAIPEDESGYGMFRLVRDQLRVQLNLLLQKTSSSESPTRAIRMSSEFYRMCNDIRGINAAKSKPLLDILSTMPSGWPFPGLASEAVQSPARNFTTILAKLKKKLQSDSLITTFVFADSKNTSRNVLFIDQGTLGLPTRDYYLNDTVFGPFVHAYKVLMMRTIKLLAYDDKLNVSDEALRTFADQIIDFERALANITSPEDNRRNHTRMYNRMYLSELKKFAPAFDWDLYMNTVLEPEVSAVVHRKSHYVIVQELQYMKDLGDLLKSTKPQIVSNYMYWRVVKQWMRVLDERFEDILQDFLHSLMGRQNKPARWKACLQATVASFDMATGALYVAEHFDSRDKNEALSMIRNLQASFKELVSDLDWMDSATKRVAKQKVNAMGLQIGYPELAVHPDLLDEYYEDLIIGDSGYFDASLEVQMWMQDRLFHELIKPFNRSKFDISPAVVNAFYSAEKNVITFPAGILQPPFFRGDYPKCVNYGAMGAVIGHEITHGFDDQGSQYDKMGNLQDWWSETAKHGFEERKQCIINQYGSYKVPEINMYVNGILTQGENIADNGGVVESYNAYRKYIGKLGHEEPKLPGLNLTNDQIFFLSFATFWCGHKKLQAAQQQVLTDPHSPEMFRVIGVMSNSDDFAKAYGCKPGSKMNPFKSGKSKCKVW